MENVGGVLVHTHKPRGLQIGGKKVGENRSFISLSCAWDGNADAGRKKGGGEVKEKEKKVVTRDGRGRDRTVRLGWILDT